VTSLKPLAFQLDNESNVTIIGVTGEKAGSLLVNVKPTDESGEGEPAEEDIIDEPEEMIGK